MSSICGFLWLLWFSWHTQLLQFWWPGAAVTRRFFVVIKKKVREKEKQQKPSFVDSRIGTDGHAHYPPQVLTTTHLRSRYIWGTQYVLWSLNLDQCYFCLASMNCGPCTVIELATQYLGTNNQRTQPRKNKAFCIHWFLEIKNKPAKKIIEHLFS